MKNADPFTHGLIAWRGVEREATLVTASRWTAVALAAFLGAILVGFGVVMVPLVRWPEDAVGVLFLGALLLPLIPVAVHLALIALGRNVIAFLPEGLLARVGLVEQYVPWSAIEELTLAEVRHFDETGSYTRDELRLRVRDSGLVESNWAGRLRRWRLGRRVPLPDMTGEVDTDVLVEAISRRAFPEASRGWTAPATCPECEHELAEHREDYGCDHEDCDCGVWAD